jgi:hypothetical protein
MAGPATSCFLASYHENTNRVLATGLPAFPSLSIDGRITTSDGLGEGEEVMGPVLFYATTDCFWILPLHKVHPGLNMCHS